MLTESFIVSTESPQKSNNANSSKDVGIHYYDFQPLPARKASYKKSSTKPSCLAVTTTHIFAAQAEKSVVHVYERETNTQEAVVPFPERIRSIALSGDIDGASTLVLGTEGGRVILWELCTGRQVSTPQSHLQPTTCLAVDPTSNFLLSGSPDANIHLWSIPSLLSFLAPVINDPSQPLPFSPLKSLSNHRASINALVFGHSSSTMNIAVSASADNTCIVWDYLQGLVLHTFLLPDTPLCLALDPADRAVYAGFEDGSIQLIDFYAQHSANHTLYDPALQSTPTQPPTSDRWRYPGEKSSANLTIQPSYDGTTLLSGHQNGIIQTWDVAKGRPKAELADLSTPITNLIMLPPTGFPNPSTPPLKIHKVIKPRYETTLGNTTTTTTTNNLPSTSLIPATYTITAQFTSSLPNPRSPSPSPSPFNQAFSTPLFPPSILSPSIASLLTTPTTDPTTQTTHLQTQLNHALQTQKSTIAQLLKLERERYERLEDDKIKKEAKKKRRLRRMDLEEKRRKVVMAGGEVVTVTRAKEKEEEEDNLHTSDLHKESKSDLSSSTDEMTESE